MATRSLSQKGFRMTSSAFSQAQGNAQSPWRSSAVAHTATVFEDSFWAPRLQTMRERTLPAIYEQMRNAGHFEAFQQWREVGVRPIPYVFWESDISKWIEAASYSLATHPDARLEALVDEAIAFLVDLQQPDGYLNLWFTRVEPEKRWTNLRDHHELYCSGHLFEAAAAHFQATGKRTLLDAATRYADYIESVFGTEAEKRHGYCGHEEIELALVKLYRVTGETRYLRLSQYFIEERGKRPRYFDQEAHARGEDPTDFWAGTDEYNQSHLPVREQEEIVGHAVRAMYLFSAIADLAYELEDVDLQRVGERIWNHLTAKRLYITGGLGSSAGNEGFTTDYDLPNLSAYAETCAAIGLVLWNHRMLLLDADRRYADLLERALYNGVLSGLSLDGTAFFYANPLESQGAYQRQPWYKCACCPPNLARLLTSLGQYMYSVSDSNILVHLYAQSTSTITVASRPVVLSQQTSYPWDGIIQIEVSLQEPAEFGLHLRIPGWCQEAHLLVANEEVPLDLHKGYTRIERLWRTGDRVVLRLNMPIERIYAHPAVQADAGKVALMRGPLVYCLETADNAVPLQQIRLPESALLESHFDPALLGGIAVIQSQGLVLDVADWSGKLYRTTPPLFHPHTLTALPYYAWGHRETGEMCLWIYTCA